MSLACADIEELATEYLEGALSPERQAGFEGHVGSCAVCIGLLGELRQSLGALSALAEEGPPAETEQRLLDAFRQGTAVGTRLAREREEASALYEELAQESPERQRELVKSEPRFHSLGLCELLTNESFDLRFDDAGRGLELAEVAVALAEELKFEPHARALVQDLKARAWANLANARRIASDLRGSQTAFETAESHLQSGSGDALENANVLWLRAHLLSDQRVYTEANKTLDRAIGLYRRSGDRHLLGQALITKGSLCDEFGSEQAVQHLREGLRQIETDGESRLVLAAKHNLVFHLTRTGRMEEALELLSEARKLHSQLGDALNLVRLRWLEGKIADSLGQLEKAEAALLDAREGFVRQGIGYDAALVSLELATVYARQGRTAEMRQLTAETIPIFQSRGVERETMAALMMFQEAVKREQVSVAVLQEIISRLSRQRLARAWAVPERVRAPVAGGKIGSLDESAGRPDCGEIENLLTDYLEGDLSPEMRGLLESHLATCGGCAELLKQASETRGALSHLRSEPDTGAELSDEAAEGLLEEYRRSTETGERIAQERAQAPELLAELCDLPQERRLESVREERRFQTFGLCDLAMERSFDARFDDAVQTVELAELAVAIADRIDPEAYGRPITNDLRARAWGHLGNARRIASDFRGAAAALEAAESLLDGGSGEPLERARLLSFREHLLSDQARFEESLEVLDEMIQIYSRLGDRHLVGRSLIEKANCLGEAGDTSGQLRLLRESLDLLDSNREPQMILVAKHNIVANLIESGKPDEARALLDEIHPLYRNSGGRLTILRLRWLEGRIAVSMNRLNEAEFAFKEVREGFSQRGLALDAALVSLDLAVVLWRQGRAAESRNLAAEILPIFESRDVHREAIAALILFKEAAERDQVTLAHIQEIADRLKRSGRSLRSAMHPSI